jgi:hypothetical protein
MVLMKSVRCTKRLVNLLQALRQDGGRTAVGHQPATYEREIGRKATKAVLHTNIFLEKKSLEKSRIIEKMFGV